MNEQKNDEHIKYVIPEWCGMPMCYHNDGMGGCWSISYGHVTGKDYCKECEFFVGGKK